MAVERALIASSATTVCGADWNQTTGYRFGSLRLRVRSLHICNDSGSNETIQVHLVDKGDSASSSNKIIPDFSVPTKDSAVLEVTDIILEDGLTLQVVGTTGDLCRSTATYVTEDRRQ